MGAMLVAIVLGFIVLGLLAFMVGAIALGERNRALVAKQEGLDPDVGELTDIDLSGNGSLSPTPERSAAEFRDVSRGLSDALNGRVAQSGSQDTEDASEAPPVGAGWDLVTSPMTEVPPLGFNPPEPEAEPEVDPVTRLQQEAAGRPPGEFKKWNKQ